MKNTLNLVIAVLSIATFSSCGEESTTKEGEATSEETQEITEEVIIEEPVEIVSFYGSYQLTDMIPVTDGKELTEQDITYIDASKERTIGNTTLTFNEDGTFERVFPHPSGDGSMNTWTGTYTMDEEAATLVMLATMGEKTMQMDFTIVEKGDNKISINTDFGQIFMTYVYNK